MMLLRRVALLTGIATSVVGGQGVTGRVIDSTTAEPVGGVTVSVQNGRTVLTSVRTNDSGRFELRAPAAGPVMVHFKRVGYLPDSARVTLSAATPVTVTHRLRRMPVALDTMRTNANVSFFHVTPGREFFAKHMRANLGQMVSGFEIRRSKLSVIEFLGTIPGLRFTPTVPGVVPGTDRATSPPTIPGDKGYLLADGGERCLYGRIDRWSIIGLLDQQDATSVDDLLKVEDVMGVEVFLPDEVPEEWKQDSHVERLVWRVGAGGRNYLIGDTGFPRAPRISLRPDLREPVDTRVAPTDYCVPASQLQFVSATTIPQQPPCPTRYGHPVSPAKIVISSVTPSSFALPSMAVPRCGFVQIWTRVAW
jgi:hypothetical protein